MKIDFTHSSGDGWFDPENEEYSYEGDNEWISMTLENMGRLGADVDTEPQQDGLRSNPAEAWTEKDAEAVRKAVVQNLRFVDAEIKG